MGERDAGECLIILGRFVAELKADLSDSGEERVGCGGFDAGSVGKGLSLATA